MAYNHDHFRSTPGNNRLLYTVILLGCLAFIACVMFAPARLFF